MRKESVFCLVEAYLVLGEDFDEHLAKLNPSQIGLIKIYLAKKVQKNFTE